MRRTSRTNACRCLTSEVMISRRRGFLRCRSSPPADRRSRRQSPDDHRLPHSRGQYDRLGVDRARRVLQAPRTCAGKARARSKQLRGGVRPEFRKICAFRRTEPPRQPSTNPASPTAGGAKCGRDHRVRPIRAFSRELRRTRNILHCASAATERRRQLNMNTIIGLLTVSSIYKDIAGRPLFSRLWNRFVADRDGASAGDNQHRYRRDYG